MNPIEFTKKLARKLASKGLLRDAAELYGEIGENSKARQLWIRRAKRLESFGHFVVAAITYEKLGLHSAAKRCWKKQAKLMELYNCDPLITQEMWISAGKEKEAAKYGRGFTFYRGVGKLVLEEGSFLKANNYLRKALGFQSKLPIAKKLLAEIHDQLGEFEKARNDYLLEAEELEARHRSYWDAAEAYKKLGLFGKARACFLKQARLEEKRKNFKEAARCYAAVGNFRLAQRLWKKS